MTKLYLAGPLFTLAEQSFNADLARFLKKQGFEVWLQGTSRAKEGRESKSHSHGRRSHRLGRRGSRQHVVPTR